MIFFDLDGTLIDHKKAEFLGVKRFFNQYLALQKSRHGRHLVKQKT